MNKHTRLLFAALLLLALALTVSKIPLASSQGLQLVSSWVDGDLPDQDPASPLWRQAPAIEVPLSAQNIAKPFLLESKVRSVTARSLHNQDQVAVLVEWEDPTEDASSVAVQDFRDAVALQFPQVEAQPYFCMGQAGGNVNIWHWKADWQADLLARREMEDRYPDMYVDDYPFTQPVAGSLARVADYQDQNYLPALKAGNPFAAPTLHTPVEDLNAGGFGTLTSQPGEEQNVQGFGKWQDGRWRVIFSRSLASPEADDISFTSGKTYSIAFAVWDGANQERNGMKSTSQWVNLHLRRAPEAPAAEAAAPAGWATPRNIAILLIGVIAVLFLIGAVIYARLPE